MESHLWEALIKMKWSCHWLMPSFQQKSFHHHFTIYVWLVHPGSWVKHQWLVGFSMSNISADFLLQVQFFGIHCMQGIKCVNWKRKQKITMVHLCDILTQFANYVPFALWLTSYLSVHSRCLIISTAKCSNPKARFKVYIWKRFILWYQIYKLKYYLIPCRIIKAFV